MQHAVLSEHREVAVVHHVEEDGSAWGSRGRRVSRWDGERWQVGWELPARWSDLVAWTPRFARMARTDRMNVLPLGSGRALVLRGGVAWRLETGEPPRPLFRFLGTAALHAGPCLGPEGWAWFGEYRNNPDREPIRLWRVAPDARSWTVGWTLPRGTRHVHGLFRDPQDPEAMWVATGDDDGACWLYRTTDGFRTVERHGDGTQRSRAVHLFFTAEHVSWVMDSPDRTSRAVRLRRADGAIEEGLDFPAPGWFGATTTDGWHLAVTAVEEGAGVHTDRAELFASRDAWSWERVAGWRYDPLLRGRWFGSGLLFLPGGAVRSDAVWVSGRGLQGLDRITARLSIRP